MCLLDIELSIQIRSFIISSASTNHFTFIINSSTEFHSDSFFLFRSTSSFSIRVRSLISAHSFCFAQPLLSHLVRSFLFHLNLFFYTSSTIQSILFYFINLFIILMMANPKALRYFSSFDITWANSPS